MGETMTTVMVEDEIQEFAERVRLNLIETERVEATRYLEELIVFHPGSLVCRYMVELLFDNPNNLYCSCCFDADGYLLAGQMILCDHTGYRRVVHPEDTPMRYEAAYDNIETASMMYREDGWSIQEALEWTKKFKYDDEDWIC